MISYEEGTVVDIIEQDKVTTVVELQCYNKVKKAINYNKISGEINIGDKVVINTTAVNLSLGTGGQHFVMFNENNKMAEIKGKGHIMKNRYTPYQLRVLAAEEEQSEYHEIVKSFKSLNNHPVIVGTLHSMLAPITAMLKFLDENIKINYIMTDAGCLPLWFSNTVKDLKQKKLIDNTITIGHAFGGDYECVNIYTGLIVSKEALKGDITIITMGPGIVGTGTKYGFSGIEQGINIDAVNNLGGKAIAVPRIGFKDERQRHIGLSHQSITIFADIANTESDIVFPSLDKEKMSIVRKQISDNKIEDKHKIIFEDGNGISDALKCYNLNTTTMGRGIDTDPEFFNTLGAVARYTLSTIDKE